MTPPSELSNDRIVVAALTILGVLAMTFAAGLAALAAVTRTDPSGAIVVALLGVVTTVVGLIGSRRTRQTPDDPIAGVIATHDRIEGQ